jgi:hypothetical protein
MKSKRGRHEVVLTGVPANSIKIDVVNFLCNVDIDEDSIKLVEGSAYNGTKEVYIHLLGDEEVDKALEMDGCLYGSKFGRYRVRVHRRKGVESKDDQRNAIQSDRGGIPQSRNQINDSSTHASSRDSQINRVHGNIVLLDGMPPAMSREDVQYLLWGTNVSQRDISLVRDEKHPYILVFFQNEEKAAGVVRRWDGTVITTKNGKHTVRVRIAADFLNTSPPGNDHRNENVLKMTKISLKISPQEIAEFFNGYAVKDKGIHLQSDHDLCREPVAYIEFEGFEAAQKALEKDSCYLGGKFRDKRCSLVMISRIQMELEMLSNTHRRDISVRCISQYADASLNLHNRMLSTYQMMQNRPIMNPRMLAPQMVSRSLMMPGVRFKSEDPENCLKFSYSKGVESLNVAKYYVKDLETGKCQYLDQRFAPATVPSSEGLERARGLKPGSLKPLSHINNASSESDTTVLYSTGNDGSQLTDRLQHKRQSEEMVAMHGADLGDERPNKHR